MKAKIFMLCLLHNKAFTWDNLQKESWAGPSRCALCVNSGDSNDHLIMECVFTKKVWDESEVPTSLRNA